MTSSGAPTEVTLGRYDEVRAALARAPGVAEVGQRAEQGATSIKVEATLERDPLSTAGFDLIPGVRDAVHAAAGDDVLVGGPSAEEHDLRESAARDNRVIVPVALIVVFLILALLCGRSWRRWC